MTTDITIVFVYAKGKKIKVMGLEESKANHESLIKKEWRHTATLDPCLFIQHLHNKCDDIDRVFEIECLANPKI